MSKPLLFRDRNFLKLWTSQVISQVGGKMFAISCMWWLIEQNGQSAGLSLAIFLILTALPSLFLVNFIGRIVETKNPILILRISDMSGALLSLVLLFSLIFNFQIFSALLLTTLLYSTCQAFIEPTLQKLVNHVVDKKEVPTAIAFLSSTQTIAYFAGAVLGAILISQIGLPGIIILNALTYGVSYILDSGIKQKVQSEELSGATTVTIEDNENLSAIQVLQKLPFIKKILFGFAAVNFLSVPTLLLIPLYTSQLLNGDSQLLALNEASIWLGLLAGSFLGRLIVDRTDALFATMILTLFFGLSLATPGIVVNKWAYLTSLFFVGLTVGTMNVRIVTYFQLQIDDQLKGRFFSVLKASISFLTPIGYALFGFLSLEVTPDQLCLYQGFGVVILSLYFVKLYIEHKTFIKTSKGLDHAQA